MKNPTIKAFIAVATFSVFGIASRMFVAPETPTLVPDILFYAILVLNTFFSVRFFSAIIPESVVQGVVDAVLVACYIAVALALGRAWMFPFAAMILFILATFKYELALHTIPHTKVLKRKIRIDLLGAALCGAALAGSVLGYPLESAWVFAGVFALANVYPLLIEPMYRLGD